ncbi:MAG: 30S ribosomal protein S13 [Parcubacteria group bacterium]|nr:30S ribosomal protein S13 [Parcubacteria group bacterium]MBI3075117.1 30S ribosomal protein S13 [Parcubacteria group bacterium]
MRISGITIPDKKQLEFGLTVLYGVGRSRARKILSEAGVKRDAKPADVSADDENKIRRSIEQFKIEGDLKRHISSNIKRLKDIGSYRGSRHSRGLPSRGQRTKTNARTLRGARKTMGSGKRKVEKK